METAQADNLAYDNSTETAVSSHQTRINLKQNASIEILPSRVTNETLGQFVAGTEIYLPQLPGASMDDSLLAVNVAIQNRMTAIPHLAARSVPGPGALDSWLHALTELGCHRVFLIAGDPNQPAGPYKDSLQLLESALLEKHGIKQIGIAGHPQGHPHADTSTLKDALAQKRAYATANDVAMWVVTQFMFDIPLLLRWLDDWQENLNNLQVHIGIPGPTNIATLVRYAALCGVNTSARTLAKNPANLKLLGSWNPDGQIKEIEQCCNDKIRQNIGGIHLFPFGGLKKAATWLEEN
ncbi:MAG: methylenetetrahydrofolate reductase (NADPH) [Candidatus Azotimanducaceae bacterium]|jgi:methylenetetrahydrofolate reductase (NADPH)